MKYEQRKKDRGSKHKIQQRKKDRASKRKTNFKDQKRKEKSYCGTSEIIKDDKKKQFYCADMKNRGSSRNGHKNESFFLF